MATDARMSVGLPSHPKTKKLVKRLGQAAAWNLVCLILWTAANRSDGNLHGMSVEDIELAADWMGAEGAFVAALIEVRFLDQSDDGLAMHDWHEHNPWAAGADMRSAKARWNAAKRHHGAAEADRLVPEYAATRNAASTATSTTPADKQEDGSNAPSPSPSPSQNQCTHTPLAAGWALPKGWGDWALTEFPHWTAEVVRAVAANFADHWRASGGSSADWNATWQKWCRDPLTQRAHPRPADKPERNERAPPSKPAPNAALSAERTAALLAEQAARTPDAPSGSIRERLEAAKGVAALAGLPGRLVA